MAQLNLKATRFVQNGRVFYSAVAPAADLLACTEVDRWSADQPKEAAGYQREPGRSRLRKIARYVESKDAVMPTGGLANARPFGTNVTPNTADHGNVLSFKPHPGEEGPIQQGVLAIGEETLWVVDMQHRLGGFQVALEENPGNGHIANFPLAITIADGLSKMEEVDQFSLINEEQKNVRTDLARRLLSIKQQDPDRRLRIDQAGRLWEARGPVVADWLNRHSNEWKGRIMPPNGTKAERPMAIVRETSFVTSLKPVLQQPFFQRMNEEQVAEYVARFWSAIERLYPEAFSFPGNYVIQKTPGVFPLHALAPEVFELARDKANGLTVESLQDILAPIAAAYPADFWESDNEDGASQYGSMKGFKNLEARLRNELPNLAFEE